MTYDRDLIAHKLQRWDDYITAFRLPEWEAIPDFGLYMDQVVALMEQYLSFIPAEEGKDRFTPAAINNYVRLKVMPAPVKRKYYRLHVAYLLVILTMKQTLSIGAIRRLLPPDLTEADMARRYRAYAGQFVRLARFFVQQVRAGAEDLVRSTAADCDEAVESLIIQSALASGLSHILAEKLLSLAEADPAAVLAAEERGQV
jgi:hypothetical protein